MKKKNLIRLLLALAALFTFLGSVHAQNATTLETKYRQLQNKLANNQFGQPVYMDSSQQSNTISGDIYSVVNYPYSTVRTALDTPTEWCEVLMLHLNIKYCRALGKNKVEVYAGTKKPQPLKNAYKMTYNFKPVINDDRYMQIIMDAKSGPVGTSDYYMMMEAIPLKDNRTFIPYPIFLPLRNHGQNRDKPLPRYRRQRKRRIHHRRQKNERYPGIHHWPERSHRTQHDALSTSLSKHTSVHCRHRLHSNVKNA